jgi:hypothetical protein
MINKKAQMQMTMGTLATIILSVIVLVLGSYFVSRLFDKQEFKITQEVCEEEIRSNGCLNILVLDGSNLQVCYHNNNSVEIKSCEQVEVEEIDGDTVFCLETPGTNFDYCKRNMAGHYFLYKDTKRLDTRWLKEYCECAMLKDSRDYLCEPSYDTCVDEMENPYCSRYKCGSYTVEVLQ